MSIVELCFRRQVIAYVLAATIAVAGIFGYFKLGRLEDPEYTIRGAQIVTAYPGATAQEVADNVSDPIETAVQQLGKLKHVTSTSYPGRSIVMIELRDEYSCDELPQIWDELRRKVGDMADSLPQGCSRPLVFDDYGDVYGVFYAIYGDGFSYADLVRHAKLLRRELLLCDDVAKIDLIGDRNETIYLDVPRAKIAALGITPDRIAEALRGQNVPADAGREFIGDKSIAIRVTGNIDSVEELGEILIADNLRLRDIAAIHRDYEDPPSVIVRRNSRPSVGLGISTAKGGNVITMGRAVEKRMRELLRETPVGIEVDVISHQATSVETAVNGFVENLFESVLLVVAVLLFTMGMRSGLVIGSVLMLTVLATIWVMQLAGLMFERISLGAFIIALGMLVDNAIVIVEAVLVAARRGESKRAAAVAVVKQTQWSLLGGTAIAVLSFAPIGATGGATGEYCRSMFLVILISLLLSWLFAITITPLLAERFIPAGSGDAANGERDPYGGRGFRLYRRFLEWCVINKRFAFFVLCCLLLASLGAFRFVKRNFFPDSTRPQFMVHVRMPEGTQIKATDERVQAIAGAVEKLPGVTGVSTITGAGALRFLLTYAPEEPNPAYGLLLVDVESDECISDLMRQIEAAAPELTPDADVGCQRFVLGPGDPYKLQLRLTGPDSAVLRDYADKVIDVLRADGRLRQIGHDWRNRVEVASPVISVSRARAAGVSRADISRACRMATEGVAVGFYREGNNAIPVVARSSGDLVSAWAWSPARGTTMPLMQLVDEIRMVSEEMQVKRRDRVPCLTVKCNQSENETAEEALARVRPAIEAIVKRMPPGYNYEWGGEYENSNEANNTLVPTFAPILIAMVLTVLVLFNSIGRTTVIFMTLPLILVGVVGGLLIFDKPFGFMALLGFLALVGMQVKNAIVLMDEISANLERGLAPFAAVVDAGVSRVRPVVNSSLTTVLGMLPLIADAFYSAMAVTIMIGLAFATILTVIVIPINYAIIYRVKK